MSEKLISIRDVSVEVELLKDYDREKVKLMFATKSNRLISPVSVQVKDLISQMTKPGDLGRIKIVPKDGQDMEAAINVVRSAISRYVGSAGFNWPKVANTGRRAYQTIPNEEDGVMWVYVQRLAPIVPEHVAGLS